MNTVMSSLLATASLAALTTTAFAQDSQPAQPGAKIEKPADALTPVGAPPKPDNKAEPEDSDEIVITGTQIRGIKPVGSNVLSQDREEIQATGVIDNNQLLSQLPQSEFFLGLPQPGGPPGGGTGAIIAGAPFSPINRPNLRNLPGTNDSTGQQTLVLVDGHRIVPAGIVQAGVDVGLVPVGVLARTEIILDGVSAVYGSDAVGGVINYITRKRYDGVQLNVRYGIADDYWQTDANITAGKTWGSGGITLNYEFAKNSNILNKDRDFTTPLNWLIPDPANPGSYLPPVVDDLPCDVANVQNRTSSTPPGTFHAEGTGLVAGPAFCNASEFTTYYPAQKRHAGFLVFEQEITDSVTFDFTALYSKRTQVANAGPLTATAVISQPGIVNGVQVGNPYYRCTPALTPCTLAAPSATNASNQRVSFSYGPLLGTDTQRSATSVEVWHVTPQLTAELGGDWQATFLVGHGRSNTTVKQTLRDNAVQTALFNGTTFATAINPYNITDSRQNLDLIRGMLRDGFTQGKQRFTQVRMVADGPLFSLPGGEVRVAGGGEWQKHSVAIQRQDALTFALRPVEKASTNNWALFAEIVAPIVGEANEMAGIHSLVFSASGRYDDYGQYGTTFNPKLALTYMPVDWVTFRGNWGTSFRAPNAIDKQSAAAGDTATCLGTNAGCVAQSFINPTVVNPNYNFTATGNTFVGITLQGTDPNLGPETSRSWSVGADVSPPIIPGLTLSASYYHIKFENQIGRPNVGGSLNTLFATFPELYTICYAAPGTPPVGTNPGQNPPAGQPNNPNTQASLCSPAQIQAFALQAINGQAVLNQIAGFNVAYLTDTRFRNLGGAVVAGIDLSAIYRRATSFGSIDANVNITLPRKNLTQLKIGGTVTDQLLTGDPKFKMTASAGANIGDFRAQVSWRHQSGFVPADLLCMVDSSVACPTTAPRRNTRIGDFDVIDLSFRYDVNGSTALTKDLQLSLQINNVLDSHPEFNKTVNGGVIGGQTIGRLFQFGISKEF